MITFYTISEVRCWWYELQPIMSRHPYIAKAASCRALAECSGPGLVKANY